MAHAVLIVTVMRTPLLLAVTSSLLLIGCAGSGHVQYSAHVTTPELVYINSDVQVIADYREPIFYTDNYYWRYNGGVWYRSTNHTRGWLRVDVVPVKIRRIDRPTAYIRYRGQARASTGPVVRDHRAPAPSPVVRDHREERKDAKEAQKEERKEQKEAQKEERKEQKKDRKHD